MKDIVYFDAAASFLKPESVIATEVDFLKNRYANAGRGVCARAGAVDDMVRNVRDQVAKFINAEPNQVVFTSGATDSLNRIVNIILCQPWYSEMSNFTVSDLDHHSARLPWQELLHLGKIRKMFKCELDENFDININSVPKTDFLVITAMSNVIGRPQDVAKIIKAARRKNPNVVTIVDASQYVVHEKIDVKAWDCDFMVFSGHKIGADTGVGILYIKDSEKYFPDKFGGGMVLRVGDIGVGHDVSYGKLVYENDSSANIVLNRAPEKFEAGTLPLTQICGLSVAIDELESCRPDLKLIKYMYDELKKNPRIKILSSRDAALMTFVVDNMHPLDVGAMLGANNICVRVGNMCASWVHRVLGIDGSIRVSVGPWNTRQDADKFLSVMNKIVK
ncbi:MAG: aminotransferase class V-fold PLP-dependent enzyme [Alphaproteobacteria bacterium]|nr:aminotransferase class V-fold PLP-dependent enzyme [Alphaproteobacteria bacterium]